MNRTGQRWTPKEEGLLIKFFQSGNEIREISKVIGRPPDAIVHRLIELGILGAQETSRPARDGVAWSKREQDNLVIERKSGLSIDTIAAKHQRYKNAILHKLLELRLIDVNNRNVLEGVSEKQYLGHPKAERKEYNPYEVLSLRRNATNKEIRDRYMYFIKAYHPDMAISKEAKGVFEEKMKEINNAYNEIKKERML